MLSRHQLGHVPITGCLVTLQLFLSNIDKQFECVTVFFTQDARSP